LAGHINEINIVLNENAFGPGGFSFGFYGLISFGQLLLKVLNAWSPVGADNSLCKLASGQV
jgi:hypothetical protein